MGQCTENNSKTAQQFSPQPRFASYAYSHMVSHKHQEPSKIIKIYLMYSYIIILGNFIGWKHWQLQVWQIRPSYHKFAKISSAKTYSILNKIIPSMLLINVQINRQSLSPNAFLQLICQSLHPPKFPSSCMVSYKQLQLAGYCSYMFCSRYI